MGGESGQWLVGGDGAGRECGGGEDAVRPGGGQVDDANFAVEEEEVVLLQLCVGNKLVKISYNGFIIIY